MCQESRTMESVLHDIKTNPVAHKHNFEGLQRCCTINGAVDVRLYEAHAGLLGSNGGRNCDVSSGPCACGAWH